MSAVAPCHAHPRATRRSDELAGTGRLLWLALRRDRVMVPVWVSAIALMVLATADSFKNLYDTAAERADFARDMSANGSLRALYGVLYDDSLGGLATWRVGGYAAVLAGVMSLVIVVRHTREEEESGRQEMLSSAMVGRHAPLTCALLTAAVADVAAGALVALGMAALGAGGGGAVALGLAVATTGMAFAGLAAVVCQLTENTRLARGLSGAVVGLAFALRGAGDAAQDTPGTTSPLSWFTPLGWAESVRPYGDERWWVLLLPLLLAAVASGTAYALVGRRDLGAGFFPPRPGPAAAGRSLGGAFGLAWRLQRGSLFGWAIGFALAGAVFGSLANGADDLFGDNESTRELFERMGGQQGLADAFLASLISSLGLLCALYATGAVLRLRGEETGERAEPLLALPLSRRRWAAGHLTLAFVGSAAVLAVGGAAMGLSYGLAADDLGGQLPRVLGAALAQVPAVWTLAGLATLIVGALPRLAPATWGVVGACVAVGWLGPALDLPQAVLNLSPYGHLPKLPGADVSAAPFVWLSALATAFTVTGVAALRRRDMGA
ncbi:ABC transporter permease [Streptomyces sp. SAJ15]|uniref:ABC transporter permease n=1 Tax=Streptomyces sp. SAJ15 TaxID=2011095 RepID=UPI001186D1EF|nr:ABC transporter permease [Streptomyces sp. SAJ15]TVL92542.1 ABC transporter permease [Streptomyces sp. SAJ15]